MAQGGTAPPRVVWGKSKQFTTGDNAAVAMSSDLRGFVVTVYSSTRSYTLWIKTASRNPDGTLDFGSEDSYDDGFTPDVTVNDDLVIAEVHQSQFFPSLWYNLWIVDPKTGERRHLKKKRYATGIGPSVCLNNVGQVVEVHGNLKGPNETGLDYMTGDFRVVKKPRLVWNKPRKLDKTGAYAYVAMNDSGQIICTYISRFVNGDLRYRIGQLQGKRVEWSGEKKLDSEYSGTVAINSEGQIIVLSGNQYRTGQLTAGSVVEWANWIDLRGFGSVALNREGQAVQVFEPSSKNPFRQPIRYRGGRIA